MSRSNDGCVFFLTIIIAACFILPLLFKGCVSCTKVGVAAVSKWSYEQAESAAKEQQKELEIKRSNPETKNPCKCCKGYGSFYVNDSDYTKSRSDCRICLAHKRERHLHKCLSCYGTGVEH